MINIDSPKHAVSYIAEELNYLVQQATRNHKVVGWLVATSGLSKGFSFPIFCGYNRLCPYPSLDICVYDYRMKRDMLLYVEFSSASADNMQVLIKSEYRHRPQLKNGDIFTHNGIDFRVVFFCDASFVWEDPYAQNSDTQKIVQQNCNTPKLKRNSERRAAEEQYMAGGLPPMSYIREVAGACPLLSPSSWVKGWFVSIAGANMGRVTNLGIGIHEIRVADHRGEKHVYIESAGIGRNRRGFPLILVDEIGRCFLHKGEEDGPSVLLNGEDFSSVAQLTRGDVLVIDSFETWRFVPFPYKYEFDCEDARYYAAQSSRFDINEHLCSETQYGNTSKLALLIAAGADVNYTDAKGVFPLWNAVEHDCEESVAFLLTCPGIDVNKRNHHGETALFLAVSRGLKKCVKHLLAAPGIDAQGYEPFLADVLTENTSPSESVFHRRLKMACTIPGVNINCTDSEGRTLLFNAIRVNDIDCVKLLLSIPGTDVNLACGWQETPLMRAARMQNAECVKLLLVVPGIDVLRKDFMGNTALSYACQTSSSECVQLLKHAVAQAEGSLGG